MAGSVSAELPRLRCVRSRARDFVNGEIAAWPDLERAMFRDAVTGDVPRQQTRVSTAWTQTHLRVLFECVDSDPWATLTERDALLYQEETVEVFLDPVGDLEAYFEVEINPIGTLLDLVFRRSRSGYKGDRDWDCEGLLGFARRTDDGWFAELGIPFASIGATPQPGAVWRVNFCRIDRPSRDNSIPRELTAWSPPLRETFHTPERFGYLEFAD